MNHATTVWDVLLAMANNLPAVLAAVGGIAAAWIGYKNHGVMQNVQSQTNGLTAKLVDSASKEGHTQGMGDQKAADRAQGPQPATIDTHEIEASE